MSKNKTGIKLYIDGLDVHLEPGVPVGHTVLISGTTGSMKSTIAFNILFHNALKEGVGGIYITLEESKDKLLDQMECFGMDYKRVKDKLVIIDLAPIRRSMQKAPEKTPWIDFLKMQIESTLERGDFRLLVIDSLNVLELLARFKDPRIELFHIFEWLKELGMTCFVVSELNSDSKGYSTHGEDFMADGIIFVGMEKVGAIDVHRRIRIVKMRGSKHDTSYYTLLTDDNKFQVTQALG